MNIFEIFEFPPELLHIIYRFYVKKEQDLVVIGSVCKSAYKYTFTILYEMMEISKQDGVGLKCCGNHFLIKRSRVFCKLRGKCLVKYICKHYMKYEMCLLCTKKCKICGIPIQKRKLIDEPKIPDRPKSNMYPYEFPVREIHHHVPSLRLRNELFKCCECSEEICIRCSISMEQCEDDHYHDHHVRYFRGRGRYSRGRGRYSRERGGDRRKNFLPKNISKSICKYCAMKKSSCANIYCPNLKTFYHKNKNAPATQFKACYLCEKKFCISCIGDQILCFTCDNHFGKGFMLPIKFKEPNNVFSLDAENEKGEEEDEGLIDEGCLLCHEERLVHERRSLIYRGYTSCHSCDDIFCELHIKKCDECDITYCLKCQKHHKTNCEICGENRCAVRRDVYGEHYIRGRTYVPCLDDEYGRRGTYVICKCGIKTSIGCAGRCNFGCGHCGKIACANCASKCCGCNMICCSDCNTCSGCKKSYCERCLAYIKETKECLCVFCFKKHKMKNQS